MDKANQTKLFAHRGALAFFAAIFLNASVDLGHKIVIQNTIFKLYEGDQRILLTALANALVVLPYIAFFLPAGQINDRFHKARVMQISAWLMLLATCLVLLFYALGWFWPALISIFFLGTQSAFYGPAKLSYIRVMYPPVSVTAANGVAQALVIAAILVASLGFSVAFEWRYAQLEAVAHDASSILRHMLPLAFLLLALALYELWLVYRIPARHASDRLQPAATSTRSDGEVGSLSAARESTVNLATVTADPLLIGIILGLTMFWSSGQVMLAVFPEFFYVRTGQTNTAVIQAVLACLALGVGLGSLLAGALSRQGIRLELVAIGGAGIVLSLLMLQWVQSIWTAVLCFLLAGTMGGLFIVPLHAVMQLYVKPAGLGRTLAINNFYQNVFMALFLGLTMLAALHSISAASILAALQWYASASAALCAVLLYRQRAAIRALASASTVADKY